MAHQLNQASGVGPQPTGRAARISVEDEASLMNRGSKRNLALLIAGALLVIGVGALVVQRIGRADAYAQAAASTARISRDHFAGFFDCALPGARASELNAQRVQTGFARLGEREGKSYAGSLTKCLPQLRNLTAGVEALQMPAFVARERAGLVAATSELAAANTHYLYYLNDGIAPYESTAAAPLQRRLGAAWAGYRAAEAELVQAIEQRP